MPLTVFSGRLGSYRGADGLDITRAHAGPLGACFAPSWPLLRAAKELQASTGEDAAWAWYRPLYVEEMRASYREHRTAWNELLARETVTLMCVCPDPAQCHRSVLAELLVQCGATYAGERPAPQQTTQGSLSFAGPPGVPQEAAEPAPHPDKPETLAGWRGRPWLVVDTETTGLDPEQDRVIEIAFCRVEHGAVVDRAAWLLNPGRPLPPEATAIHGLTDADLADAPSFAEIAPLVEERLLSVPVVAAYNAPFDRGMVAAELRRAGRELPDRPWLDPLAWIWRVDRYQRGKKLIEACGRRLIRVEGAHRAAADAEMAALLMLRLLDELPALRGSVDEVVALQGQWRAEQEAFRAQRPAAGR